MLGGSFEEFIAHDSVEKTGFILGCENWNRSNFKALLSLVKNFVLSVRDARKNELYGGQDGETSGCSCPLTGDFASFTHVCGCVVNGVIATAAT